MTEKQTEAAELFLQGYNCAQSVCGAFAQELGMDKELLLDMSAAFGGGFARTRNLCGAVSGIGMVISLSMRASAPQENASGSISPSPSSDAAPGGSSFRLQWYHYAIAAGAILIMTIITFAGVKPAGKKQ